MSSPLISVVIPLYRSKRFLDRVMVQLVRSWTSDLSAMEVIFVDDASGDGTLEAFEERAETDLAGSCSFIARETNGRAMAARLTGAQHARGNYLIFCDVDDTWGARYFEECWEYLCSGATPAILLRPIDYTFDRTTRIHKVYNPSRRAVVPGDQAVVAYSRRQLGLGGMWGRMIQRDLWLECVALDADLPVFIDSDLTLNFRLYHEADAVHILPGDAYSWLQTGISAHDNREHHLAMMKDRVAGLAHLMNWMRPVVSAEVWQEVLTYNKLLFQATLFAATSWDQICPSPSPWDAFLADQHLEIQQFATKLLRDYFARPELVHPPRVVHLNLVTPCGDVGELPVLAATLSSLPLGITWTCVLDSAAFPSAPELPQMPIQPEVMTTGEYATVEASFNRLLGGKRWHEHFAVLPSNETVPVAFLNALPGRTLDYAQCGTFCVLSYRAIGNIKISNDVPEAWEEFCQQVKRNSRSSWWLFR